MISEEECVKAIKSMQNGKSPGTDGLPVFNMFISIGIRN
jgi:hypothetical protein